MFGDGEPGRTSFTIADITARCHTFLHASAGSSGDVPASDDCDLRMHFDCLRAMPSFYLSRYVHENRSKRLSLQTAVVPGGCDTRLLGRRSIQAVTPC